jgi:hypothetical protein
MKVGSALGTPLGEGNLLGAPVGSATRVGGAVGGADGGATGWFVFVAAPHQDGIQVGVDAARLLPFPLFPSPLILPLLLLLLLLLATTTGDECMMSYPFVIILFKTDTKANKNCVLSCSSS